MSTIHLAEAHDQSSESPRILVLGASGYVGSHLVPRLVESGYQVRAAGRNSAELKARFGSTVELCTLDLLQPDTLAGPLEGVEVVYYLVHSMLSGDDFAARDLRAARILAAAAEQAEVGLIVYLGAACPDNTRSEHLISRRETGAALASGAVPVVELRAPVVVGAGSVPFEAIRDMVNHLPAMVLPMAVRHTSAPLALGNLLYYLVALAGKRSIKPGVYLLAGPERLSYEEQIHRYARVVGKRFYTLRIPGLWLGLVRLAMPLFSSAPSSIVRALLGGLSDHMPSNAEAIRECLPQRLLSYEEAVSEAIEEESRQPGSLYWYQGNPRFREGWPNAAYYGDCLVIARETALPASALWRVLSRIGGRQRFFTMNGIWAIREWIDFCVGGPGRQLGRDTPDRLVVGERVDSWQILDVVDEQRVLLGFRMRGPGAGTLEFRLQPLAGGGTEIQMLAYWHPAGLWGQLYWYTMMRPHSFLFRRMLKAIERIARAELKGTPARP
ncbi:DUF2867 domain-containing protein [Aestuariirhabdus litorea]|uniref:DUF2867 domain-containing protein n=1 Tax=Aestuariirhabdus litorea TaxID=2528527 RepID=A0A3P3VMT7_9GAMM|nr:DUF2867 domain-containing protein [Aestuariirhabdus litorea]RRJ83744.1 DUF2867 domain-containing protein [Aestuariirhabdus litorea]RWW96967.1 DUF2867 domain-containing protein [Endozoicomonadaceae bacterium GTF-13]